MYKFDVFGKMMTIKRVGEEWHLFNESATAMRARVYDVVIPPEFTESELATFLDDIYHEYATEQNSEVKTLS